MESAPETSSLSPAPIQETASAVVESDTDLSKLFSHMKVLDECHKEGDLTSTDEEELDDNIKKLFSRMTFLDEVECDQTSTDDEEDDEYMKKLLPLMSFLDEVECDQTSTDDEEDDYEKELFSRMTFLDEVEGDLTSTDEEEDDYSKIESLYKSSHCIYKATFTRDLDRHENIAHIGERCSEIMKATLTEARHLLNFNRVAFTIEITVTED